MLRLFWYLIVGYDWRDTPPSKFPLILNSGNTSIYLKSREDFCDAIYINGEAIIYHWSDKIRCTTNAKCDQIKFEAQLMRLK